MSVDFDVLHFGWFADWFPALSWDLRSWDFHDIIINFFFALNFDIINNSVVKMNDSIVVVTWEKTRNVVVFVL